MSYASMVGVGSYLPRRVLHNSELAARVDTSDEWIRSRTGIVQRHIAADDEGTADMAYQAALRALQAAGAAATDMDMIIVATTTPDNVFPGTACAVQQKLGNSGIPAFDVQAVCSGFVYAVDIGDKYIRNGDCQQILIIGADSMSRIIDWDDRNSCVLFGDGAGAVVLRSSDKPGIMYSRMRADGSYQQLLHAPGGPGARQRQGHLHMDGRQVFRLAVELVSQELNAALRASGLTAADIDWLVPHQANRRIMHKLAQRSGIAPEKVLDAIATHGNTSAASIPLALQHGIADGSIRAGQKLLLAGFGGGFTWGTIVMRYQGAEAA